ncbi:MAG: hypothetical protein ACRBCK_12060 [Alphaproteobacteria bacterium]
MSIPEIDIYRTAQIFINKHGSSALLESMKKEEELFEKGDVKGANVWHKITDAIEWLQIPDNLTSLTKQ